MSNNDLSLVIVKGVITRETRKKALTDCIKLTAGIISKRTGFKFSETKLVPGTFRLADRKEKTGNFTFMFALAGEAAGVGHQTKDIGANLQQGSKSVSYEFNKVISSATAELSNSEFHELMGNLVFGKLGPIKYEDIKEPLEINDEERLKMTKKLETMVVTFQRATDLPGKLLVRRRLMGVFALIGFHAPKGHSNIRTDFEVSAVSVNSPNVSFHFLDKEKWDACAEDLLSIFRGYSDAFTVDGKSQSIVFTFPGGEMSQEVIQESEETETSSDSVLLKEEVVVESKEDVLLEMISTFGDLPEDIQSMAKLFFGSLSEKFHSEREELKKMKELLEKSCQEKKVMQEVLEASETARKKAEDALVKAESLENIWTTFESNKVFLITGVNQGIEKSGMMIAFPTEDLKPLSKSKFFEFFKLESVTV